MLVSVTRLSQIRVAGADGRDIIDSVDRDALVAGNGNCERADLFAFVGRQQIEFKFPKTNFGETFPSISQLPRKC